MTDLLGVCLVLSLVGCAAPREPCHRYWLGDSCAVGSECLPASSPVGPSTGGMCAKRCASDADCTSAERCTDAVAFASGPVCWD